MDSATPAAAPARGDHGSDSLATLTLGAIGVVFGDIGTSPLYAFREALAQAAADGIVAGEILGVLSLALWALLIVVTIKYVLFLMRADNEGEGGVLALMALAQRTARRRRGLVLVLGAIGASLFYGDGIITPALSVLSAVEGLRTIPSLADHVGDTMILSITVAILVALFAFQSRGTAGVSRLFGPVCVLWFVAIGALGAVHVRDAPGVLAALSPSFGVAFLAHHGVVGLFALGAVFLTVTGAEALTADMSHFGVRPIRIGWFALVFPALILNYLGQGALALSRLAAAGASGRPFPNQDWFFMMAPDMLRVPLVILATLATIIASQAVITGAFSLTQQAIQLGMLPRLSIRQTSARAAGQVYLPIVNLLLFVGVLILVFGFRNSSAMAAAYGIAVTGTMVVTTSLAFIVLIRVWGWRPWLAALFIAPFLALDLVFYGANILRVAEGGWVPLLVAAIVGLVIASWTKGRRLVREQEHEEGTKLVELARMLALRPPRRVAGTAVFLASNVEDAPVALLHNLKHNKVLHERNFVLTARTANIPVVAEDGRLTVERIDDGFARIVLHYGFIETPDVPRDLALVARHGFDPVMPMATSYFIGRSMVQPAARSAMPHAQDLLFVFLQRNAWDPTDFFRIPPNRVVELGSQLIV